MIGARNHELSRSAQKRRTGALIINADDWGREREVTSRTLDCILCGSVSSVSAMVFMADSERAAEVARERDIDAGLHLNFTTPFSGSETHSRLRDHQHRVSSYLRRHRLAQVMFHPGLAHSFAYLTAMQVNEFVRLYGREPDRLDGHHHMHLCSNVILAGILPSDTIVRRNFSFGRREKPLGNLIYRRVVDRILAQRHRLTDFFFALQPLELLERLRRIVDLSRQFIVEVETHPQEPAEYSFLAGGKMRELIRDCLVAPRFDVGVSQKTKR